MELLESAALTAAYATQMSLWYVKEDLSNVWIDANQVYPATLVNDPIGYIGDALGLFPAKQTLGVSRKPKLTNLSSGYRGIAFDGVNDFISTGPGYSIGEYSEHFAIMVAGTCSQPNKVAFGSSAGTTSNNYIGKNNVGAAEGVVGSLTLNDVSTWNTPRVVTMVRDGNTATVYVDGILVSTGTDYSVWNTIAPFIGAMNNQGIPTNHWAGTIGLVGSANWSIGDDNRIAIERFAAAKVGANYII